MSSQATKPCPRCNTPSQLAFDSGGLDGHTAHTVGEMAIKSFMLGHLIIGTLWAGAGAVKALMPKKYRCRHCQIDFK